MRHLLRILPAVLVAGFAWTATAQPFRLAYDLSANAGSYRAAAAWVDFGHDTDLDVVISGNLHEQGPLTSLARNRGGFRLQPLFHMRLFGPEAPGSPIPGMEFGSIDVGDVDKDGNFDLLMTGRVAGWRPATHLYRTALDGLESEIDWGGELAITALPPVESGAGRWGDVDGDGDLDVVLTGLSASGYVTRLFRNDGAGLDLYAWRFTELATTLMPVAHSAVTWTDVDTDGDLDLVVTGAASHPPGFVASVYRNDGPGPEDDTWRFSALTTPIPGLAYGTVDAADYDDDGDDDLLVSGCTNDDCSQSFTGLYRNDGATPDGHAFTPVVVGFPGVYRSAVAWGDVDADGDLDLVLAGEDSARPGTATTRIYRNDGADRFTELETRLAGVTAGAVRLGDMDVDGDLDLLVVGYDYAAARFTARIYRNDIDRPNTPPEPPTGLEVVALDETSATLRWHPADDAETPAPGLTYNLRIGTGTVDRLTDSDQLGDVMSPLSRLAGRYTGRLIAPAPGNTGHRTEWTIDGLVPGTTYYWSVQAVDHGFASSPFSAEGTFTTPGSNDNFLARLTVADVSNNTRNLFFGIHSNARSGFDSQFDVPAVPSTDPRGFDTYLVLPDGTSLLRDQRPPEHETTVWELYARPFARRTIHLTWKPELLPPGGHFRIAGADVDVDMRAQNSLVLPAPNGVRLLISYTRTGHQAPTGTETPAPAFALHGPFPNPAVHQAQIAIDLPAAADVRLELFDLLGRRVREIPWHSVAPGSGRRLALQTDGLPSGSYLYRLQVRDAGHGLRLRSGPLVVLAR